MANFIQNVQAGPYAGDQQEILRKQKLAQMLQAQSMEPIQAPQVGAFASPISPLQVLAKGLQAYKGKEAETQAKTQSEELSKRQQSERQAALSAALRQGMGAPQPPAEMGGGPAMPPDPMGAAGTLMGAPDPELQKMGGSIFAQQMKPKPQPEPFNLSPGQTRFGPDGKPIANLPPTPPAPPQPQPFNLSPGQTRFGPDGRPIANLPPTPPQPPQRQQQVIQTEQGPMILGEDGQVRPITGPGGAQVRPPARQGGPMTATAQKELIETEEQVQGGQAALELFKQAKALNSQAMGFTGAGALASAGSILPSGLRPGTVDATQNLDNILQSAALPQLKAIFGGMPTEGERKILLDVQGSSSKPANVRKDIFDRAQRAIEARMKFAGEKAKRLREGTYFTGEGLPSLQPQGGGLSAEEQAELQQLRQRLGR